MNAFANRIVDALKDLAPIILVIAFFQIVVLQQPFPDPASILIGLVAVVVGLALFIQGLELSLFPIGENMAGAFARKGSVFWLLLFAFALGFGTTVAEPALIAVSQEAARISSDAGMLADTEAAQDNYAIGLRLTVAFSVGFAILIGEIGVGAMVE